METKLSFNCQEPICFHQGCLDCEFLFQLSLLCLNTYILCKGILSINLSEHGWMDLNLLQMALIHKTIHDIGLTFLHETSQHKVIRRAIQM